MRLNQFVPIADHHIVTFCFTIDELIVSTVFHTLQVVPPFRSFNSLSCYNDEINDDIRALPAAASNAFSILQQLRHIIGRAIPKLPRDLRITHVRQEVTADDRTCLQTVIDSDEHLKNLNKRKAELEVRFFFFLFFQLLF